VGVTALARRPALIAVALAALALVVTLQPRPPHPGSARPPEESGPYPSDWFYAQRAFPQAEIPYERWLAAVEQARVERAALGTQAAQSLVWQEIGPYNVGGRVTAIAAPPGGNPVYVGGAAGGVFKSVDDGVSFTPVFDAVGVFSIGAIAVDPTDPNVVYVGTGEANSSGDSYGGAGIFKSVDGGASWSFSGLGASRYIARIAVDPGNPQHLYAAAMGNLFTPGGERGVYRSQDGGASWQRVLFVNDSTGAGDVALKPGDASVVYAATWERRRTAFYRRAWGPGSGVWRSTDYGEHWTRLTNGFPTTSRVGRIALSAPTSQPGTVYAQVVDSTGNGLGFYRSTDDGASWTRRDVGGFTGYFGGFGWYFGTTAVNPSNPSMVWALGVDLARSLDGGATWTPVSNGIHVDMHDLWVDPSNPQHMFAGNDGGFYRSSNGGSSWSMSLDLPLTQFYAGDVDAGNVDHVIGGTQDNSTPMTTGGLGSWSVLFAGDGFYALIDPAKSSTLFAEYQYGSGGVGPYKSYNSGQSFSPTGSGIVGTDRFNWSTPYAFAPGSNQVMVLGSHRVYRSTNQGSTWQPISPDLTGGAYGGPGALVYGTVTTVAVAAANYSVIYAGTDDARVWVTTNGGGSWTNVSAGLPVRWVTRVAVDPSDPATAYVTLSGYRDDVPSAHVFRTTTAGTSWTDISGNLPDAPVNDIVPDPARPGRLYVGTDVGVYATLDLGGRWFPLGEGIPGQAVVDLTLHEASRSLIAFTHGRSAWKLDLAGLDAVAAPAPSLPRLALGVSPNPSRGPVTLAVDLPEAARVSLGVFDAMGRRVADLGRWDWRPGRHAVVWDGSAGGGRAPAGVYYARVAAPAGVLVKPIHRLR
jgi:hypothetical protein